MVVPESQNDLTGAPHPLRRALRKAVRTAHKRVARKVERLREECEACGASQAWLEAGEILKANLPSLARGMDTVTLPDPYHPGSTRTIVLEPRCKPLENARRYFKKYRKLADGVERKQAELALAEEEAQALAALLDAVLAWIEHSEPVDAPLETLFEQARALRVGVQSLPRAPAATKKNTKDVATDQSGIRTYTSVDGFSIFVGKAARDNDRLAFRIAKGNDWWFHIAHYAGSHVVVQGHGPGKTSGEKMADKKRRKDAQALPPETLLDAAHLALHFSKARGASKAEVTYTQAKHLHKRKGAPAGQVMLNQSRSVLIRVEEARLRRLLKRHDTL